MRRDSTENAIQERVQCLSHRPHFVSSSSSRRNNNKEWFEAHRDEYENDVREPMRELIEELDVRFARFAPEIGGDPKRSMFRINRDIRFSKDKSPYKTNAGCWFHHRSATRKVGSEADEGSAGFYFHLQPGESFLGGGVWMPPRPQLNKLRDAIAERPQPLFGWCSRCRTLRRSQPTRARSSECRADSPRIIPRRSG